MINLSVHDYCQKCNHFKADVKEPELIEDAFGEMVYYGDFIIKCKHRKICEDLLEIKEKEKKCP